MANLLLKLVRNFQKNGHSLKETQNKLKKYRGADDVKIMWEYVEAREKNRQKNFVGLRISDNLLEQIEKSGKNKSKLIKLALEEHFAREKPDIEKIEQKELYKEPARPNS